MSIKIKEKEIYSADGWTSNIPLSEKEAAILQKILGAFTKFYGQLEIHSRGITCSPFAGNEFSIRNRRLSLLSHDLIDSTHKPLGYSWFDKTFQCRSLKLKAVVKIEKAHFFQHLLQTDNGNLALGVFDYLWPNDMANLETAVHTTLDHLRVNLDLKAIIQIMLMKREGLNFPTVTRIVFLHSDVDNTLLSRIPFRELFPNLKEVKLFWCDQITDAGLAYLTNCSEVTLFSCDRITDTGLAHLKNCSQVDLSGCSLITDAGLSHLANCSHVNLSRCKLITDAGLAHLKNCSRMHLSDCSLITDAGLAHLANCSHVNLSWCDRITDAGLAHLANCSHVNLSWCDRITDAGLAHLTNCSQVILSRCRLITDAGLAHLKNCSELFLSKSSSVSQAAVERLRACGCTVVMI